MKSFDNLHFTFRVFEAGLIVAGVNCVFSEKLPATRLGHQHVVFYSEVDCTTGPPIRIGEQPIVLMSTSCVAVKLGNHRRREVVDRLTLCGGPNEIGGVK